MAAKSILEIEVKDEPFRKFQELFEQYREGVKELPGAWGDVGAEVDKAGALMEAQTAGLLVQAQLLKDQKDQWKKQEEGEKRLLDIEKKRQTAIHDAWTDTVGMAKSVSGITVDLLKWVGIGSILTGLAGAGGLWGMDALAHSVGDQRRSAMGLGVSTGEQQALKINYDRYLDVDSNLEGIANAQNDLSKRWAFSAMGVNPNGKDPAQLMIEMAEQTKRLIDKVNPASLQQFSQSHGLDQFYSLDDLRRLKGTSYDELRGAHKNYDQDAVILKRSDDINKQWQDFSVQMGRASNIIRGDLIDALTPLVPALTEMSKGVADVVTAFLNSPQMKVWMDEATSGLKWFAGYIQTPEFKRNVELFATDIGLLAQKAVDALIYLNLIPDPNAKPLAPGARPKADATIVGRTARLFDPRGSFTGNINAAINPQANQDVADQQIAWRDHPSLLTALGWGDDSAGRSGGGVASAPSASASVSASAAPSASASVSASAAADPIDIEVNSKDAGRFFAKTWGDAGASAIVANLNAESSDTAHGPAGDGGTAHGVAQWHADRIRMFDAWASENHRPDFVHSDLKEQWDFVNYDLQHHYKAVGDQLKRLTDPKEAARVFSEQYESAAGSSGNPRIEAERRANAAMAISVLIQNQTGASVHVQGSQLNPQ